MEEREGGFRPGFSCGNLDELISIKGEGDTEMVDQRFSRREEGARE